MCIRDSAEVILDITRVVGDVDHRVVARVLDDLAEGVCRGAEHAGLDAVRCV